MKKLLSLAITVLLAVVAYSQDKSKNETVKVESIKILNANNRSYALGTIQQLQNAFGKTRVTKAPDEMLGGTAYTYYYNGAKVYFNENDFETIDITGKNYTVYLNGEAYRVGDNATKLKARFPISYKNRGDEQTVWMALTLKGTIVDSYVSIDLDKGGSIKSITISNDNS